MILDDTSIVLGRHLLNQLSHHISHIAREMDLAIPLGILRADWDNRETLGRHGPIAAMNGGQRYENPMIQFLRRCRLGGMDQWIALNYNK